MNKVFLFYAFDCADNDTLKHVNEYAQTIEPGPYTIIYDVYNNFEVIFKWESDEQQTWYTLKWS